MRVLRQREVMARTGYSAMTLWRKQRDGSFPRRIKLGNNSIGWLEEEIDDWIRARVAERDALPPAEDPGNGRGQ